MARTKKGDAQVVRVPVGEGKTPVLRVRSRPARPRRAGVHPVLIDTDIGDDVDDALALGLAACSPELDLVGVTTVYGDVQTRTQLALCVLDAFGRRDVPVATGLADPLVETGPTRKPNQAGVLDDAPELPDPHPGSAVQFIIDQAKARPGELTLITIGAMTNAAVALKAEPELASTLKQILVMGGVVTEQRAEWNVKCDPEAAQIVFNCGAPVTMVGLDVTLQCRMTKADVRRLANLRGPHARVLSKMIELWPGDKPVLHDPLTVAAVYDPRLIRTEPHHVRVELRGQHTRAVTWRLPNGQPTVDVALHVNASRFVKQFVDRVAAGPRTAK